MKPDGIIFDLDGTLWDSCRVVAESWADTLRRHYGAERVPSAEDARSIMGLTAEGIARRCFSQYGQRAMEVCLKCLEEENAYIARHSGDVYPGVEKMLQGDAHGDVGRGREAREEAVGIILKRNGAGGQR